MNELHVIKETPNKSNMGLLVNNYLNDVSLSPLTKYLNLKAIEYCLKLAMANKEFRAAVKEDYLIKTEGSLSKCFIMGVEMKTVSQYKKNELAKSYIYSEKINKLESDIEVMEAKLKAEKEYVKAQKLIEINEGTATELVPDAKEKKITDEFNLMVTFKENI